MKAPLKDRSVGFWLRIMAVVVVLSFAMAGYAIVQQASASARAAAERKSNDTTQVGNCYQQVKNAPAVLSTLDLIDALASNSIMSSTRAIELNPDDPLNNIRRASIARLSAALKDLRDLVARTQEKLPTEKSCHEMAVRLGVDDSKLNNT